MSAICNGNIRSIAGIEQTTGIQTDSASKEGTHLPSSAFILIVEVYAGRGKWRLHWSRFIAVGNIYSSSSFAAESASFPASACFINCDDASASFAATIQQLNTIILTDDSPYPPYIRYCSFSLHEPTTARTILITVLAIPFPAILNQNNVMQ